MAKKRLRMRDRVSIHRRSTTSPRPAAKLSTENTLAQIAQEKYAVQSRQPHASPTKEDNPFCPVCRWRTYPQWGEHRCEAKPSEQEMGRIRRHTGHLVSNLHFYRFPPADQAAICLAAFAAIVGRNLHPRQHEKKLRDMLPKIAKVVAGHVGRHWDSDVAAVMAPSKPTIKRRK